MHILPRNENLSVRRISSARRLKRFRHTEANLDGQVEAKPDAHARLTDHLARVRTRTCLQAEESPQLDEQQKASTAKGIPKIHGTSTSTIHSFGRRFRLYLLPFSFSLSPIYSYATFYFSLRVHWLNPLSGRVGTYSGPRHCTRGMLT